MFYCNIYKETSGFGDHRIFGGTILFEYTAESLFPSRD
jgi:hypothetical protein